MIIDSKTRRVETVDPVYVVSEPESWGQPSAGQYIFVVDGARMFGQLISGVYISSQSDVLADNIPASGMYEAEPMYEEEPEDAIIADSGILPQLIAQARQEPPSSDWERELYEL